ncbi:MAG: hypothetical protein HRU36_02230 [Rickettsiales bacterium]|nr:hypothetical protein [Rickettsiales bacterium]
MSKTKIAFSLTMLLNLSIAALALNYPFSGSFLMHNTTIFKKNIFSSTKAIQNTKFFTALGYKESGSKYKKVNKFGYLGKYQFGESALVGLGYYNKDGSAKNDWKGKWTGKYGVFSKQDFLNNPIVQEIAARELATTNWNIAKSYKLDKFIGKKVYGIHITKEGILAAMHLKGPNSVNKFIFHGINSTDALGTGVRKYMFLFSNYEKHIL